MAKMHVNFMQIIRICMKILFRKYRNAVIVFGMDWSHDLCHELNFMWPGALGLEQQS